METTKMSFEYQVKGEKDKLTKMEKELDKVKVERAKWETKSLSIETELNVRNLKIEIGWLWFGVRKPKVLRTFLDEIFFDIF